MVTEIPTPSDFRNYGLRYVNLGWGMALGVVLELGESEDWGYDVEPDVKADFLKAAEPEFATALTLIEQGIEFLIKARIAEVSPWLLISRDADGWPRRCDKEYIEFSAFHTIDAQDILKVHNTFMPNRLPEEFATAFDALRKKRNAMMHTVDLKLRASAVEIVQNVLLSAEHLIGPHKWSEEREAFLEESRNSVFDSDLAALFLAREFNAVVSLLERKELIRFFDFDKRQRIYSCPVCSHAYKDAEFYSRTAQLRPNTPKSTTLYCFVCRNTSTVERRSCTDDGCKGNVISEDYDECLTCNGRQSP
jgi:hypothetical protein